MAKTFIRSERKAAGSTYSVIISYVASDRQHEIMLQQHGPCKDVELGGSFTETVPVVGPISVILPSTKRDFPDMFPYTQIFTATQEAGDYEAAMNKAKAWEIHMTKTGGVIETALQTLWDDSFDGADFEDNETAELVTT